MKTRSISRIAGILYISTILAYPVSNVLLKERLVDAENVPGTFSLLADHALQFRAAVSIDLLIMVAVMALAFSLFVILKPVSPYLALLALGWRIGEVVLQAGAAIPDYLLLTVSQSAVSSSGNGLAVLEHLGRVLMAGSTQAVWVSFVFFSIGSLFNNYLFYKSKAIPTVLAIYGLVSTVLYALGSLLALFVNLPESANLVMMLPLVLFELSLGFYLAIFGMSRETT